MSEVKFLLTAGTNMGLVRQNNEDNYAVCANLANPEWSVPQVREFSDLGEYGSLLVVADGMGGENAGEVASQIAIETIQQEFIPQNFEAFFEDDQLIQQFMKDVVKKADLEILNQSEQDGEKSGMGTTIVILWVLGHRAYVCWCGDSRCYVLSRRYGLTRLSKDHSYVQELVDMGELHPDYASEHPLSNIITRCLGNREKRAQPDTRIYELHQDDILMLCSDGLCGLCPDAMIEDVMETNRMDLEVCRDELISVALNAGGDDNVTVGLCAIQIEDEEVEDEVNKDGENEDEEANNKGEIESQELASTVPYSLPKPKMTFFRVLLLLLCLSAFVAWLFYEKYIVWPF